MARRSRTMTPAAVIFDCDGVIVDSERIAFDLLSVDLAAHGLPMSHADMEAAFLGGTIHGLRVKANALGAALPEGWVDDFYRRLYARLAQGTSLIPGIGAVLDRLDAAGIPYAVGSNGSMEKMHITLGQHAAIWARLEKRLYSGQNLGKPKPDPAVFLLAARDLGVDPAACVVVDDSATGCIAAARAGMRCMGFASSGDGARLAAEGAVVFRDMTDLPGLLGV
jgi:HAD superfamily hydrolase (TIGR01509 family)